MTDHARKNLGSILGMLLGLIYALVALNINHLLLSKIPLYIPFPGRVATILLIGFCGIVVGRLAVWSTNVIRSLIISAATGAVLSTLISFYLIAGNAHNLADFWRIIFYYLLHRGLIIFGIGWLIWQVIKIWERELQTINFSLYKMIVPILGLMIVVLPFGLLSIYPISGQLALEKTNELIESGLSVGDYTQLPAVLLPVDGFIERSKGKYTMQLSNNPNAMSVQLPLLSEDNRGYTVLVRFENGFRFGCVYLTSNPEPACAEY